MRELHKGNTKTFRDFTVPDEAIGCGFHEAVRGVLSHHVVIRDGQDRQLSSVSAHAVERQSSRHLWNARGPMKTPFRTRRSSKRTVRKISRASTSCAPCAASIPACHAAFTCTLVMARRSRSAIRPCSVSSLTDPHGESRRRACPAHRRVGAGWSECRITKAATLLML